MSIFLQTRRRYSRERASHSSEVTQFILSFASVGQRNGAEVLGRADEDAGVGDREAGNPGDPEAAPAGRSRGGHRCVGRLSQAGATPCGAAGADRGREGQPSAKRFSENSSASRTQPRFKR